MKIKEKHQMEGMMVPKITFHTRVRDESIGGDNPYRWQDVTSEDLFRDKKVILFSLPGAFTPTCSTYQLPDFEKLFPEFQKKGIEEIYCMSVNDSFTMNAWAKDQGLKNVKVVPDGSGLFTNGMEMLVSKDNLGFGQRSWRYAAVIDDGIVQKAFIEPGKMDNCPDDPYGESKPQNILDNL
jgi:peroxiredoxin